jgi:uncharacterized membrane protein YcaP (DUF421 family)
MYLAVFVLLRVVMKRQLGSASISDLLILVLIADAAQNGMADDYKSITSGILLVATLMFWNFVVDWLGFRVEPLGRLLHPGPILLVESGQPITKNLKREMMTHEELMTQLREHGIDRMERVKRAYLEADGQISVIPKD